ncbi:MAG: hypothetical protein AAF355_06630 [Myxococcota bacterium]
MRSAKEVECSGMDNDQMEERSFGQPIADEKPPGGPPLQTEKAHQISARMHVGMRTRWVWWTIAGCLLWVFPYFPKVNNPNENVRLYMTAALVEEGTYAIDTQRQKWGWTNDAACVERHPDGRRRPCEHSYSVKPWTRHHYSVKAPGTSLLGVPFYALYAWLNGKAELDRAVATWVVRAGATILPMLLFYAWYLRSLAQECHPGWATLSGLVVALGSPMFAYGLLFVSHALSAAAAFTAFLWLTRARRHREIRLSTATAAGLCAAGTSLLEYPCFPVSVLLCLYALVSLRRRRALVAFGLGALIPTLVMMHFQQSAFGNALSPGHLYVETAAFREVHERGFFGGTHFHPEAARQLLFSPRLGLIALSPFFVFALPGLWFRLRADRSEGLLLTTTIVGLFLAICMLDNWDGGWSVGPRYLVVLYPFLGYAAAHALSVFGTLQVASKAVNAAAVGLAAASLIASAVPSAWFPHPPPSIAQPLRELFIPLIRAGYAPINGTTPWGEFGALGMTPLLLLLCLGLVSAVRHLPRRLQTLAYACLPASAALLPHLWLVSPSPPAVEGALDYVRQVWTPIPTSDR